MTWDGFLLWGSAALLLALVLMPLYTALRFPAALTWPAAALALGAALLTALVLTLLVSLALGLLTDLAPGWNPWSGPAAEPVDAGLFSLLVSVFVALALTGGLLLWWLRSQVFHGPG